MKLYLSKVLVVLELEICEYSKGEYSYRYQNVSIKNVSNISEFYPSLKISISVPLPITGIICNTLTSANS